MAYLPNNLEVSVDFLKHTNVISKPLLMEYEADLKYTLSIRDTIAIMAICCNMMLVTNYIEHGSLGSEDIFTLIPSNILLFIRYRTKRRRIRGLLIASAFYFLHQCEAISAVRGSYYLHSYQKTFLIVSYLFINLFVVISDSRFRKNNI